MTRRRTLRPEDCLTKAEAAAHAKVSERTIQRWIEDGHLTRYTRQINRLAISRRELIKMLAAREAAPQTRKETTQT
jgi:predicted site-specific integrase-resolvase